ncbi:MAG: toprim domain-containing protein, partial [Bdellovibrionales bacterium]|nr:toprim domain-containing protein [Bdellovibrionales bacterium]
CFGFGGRSMDDTEPKYLNSPESLLFHKSRIFYGLFETAKYLRAKDQAIVVEGYMDLLSLFQSGIRNVVAPLGTALTSEQARLIRRYTTHVIMLFDGDNAGQLAMERSLPILLSEGLLPRALQLPEGMDPDDFIQKNGRNELEALLASAPELFVLVLNKWMEGYRGSSSEKIVIIDKASVLFRAISDTRLKDLYLAELALRLGVNQKWLQKSLEKGQNVRYDALKQEENSQDLHTTHVRDTREATDSESQKEIIRISGKLPKAEEQLVNLALMNERCLVKIRDSQVAEMFVHSGLRKILETSFLLYGQLPNKFDKLTSLLVSQVDAPEVLLKHLEKHLADLDSEGARTLVEDCSRKVRDAFLRNQSRQLSAGLRGRSTTEQLKQLEQIMNIQLDRRVQRYDNEPS